MDISPRFEKVKPRMSYYNLMVELFDYSKHLYYEKAGYGIFYLRSNERHRKIIITVNEKNVSRRICTDFFLQHNVILKEEILSFDGFMKEYDLKVPTKNI